MIDEAKEREFSKWWADPANHPESGELLRHIKPYDAKGGHLILELAKRCWLARARIAEEDVQKQTAALRHVASELIGQIEFGSLRNETLDGKQYWRQIVGVCNEALPAPPAATAAQAAEGEASE